jgi:hypothetical protein
MAYWQMQSQHREVGTGGKLRRTSAWIADYASRMPTGWTVTFDVANCRTENGDDVKVRFVVI